MIVKELIDFLMSVDIPKASNVKLEVLGCSIADPEVELVELDGALVLLIRERVLD